MDIMERQCTHLSEDALRSLSGRQFAIAYLRIEERMMCASRCPNAEFSVGQVRTMKLDAHRRAA